MNTTSENMDNDFAELAKELNDEMTRAVLPVTIIVGMEVVFGFFGNLLVIYVFLFHYRVCNFRYFVLCLAVVDITCCVTTMPGEMVTQLNWYTYPVRELCKTKSFFNVFTVSAEAFCLLTIAVDRYRKICRPFGWQIKPRIAKYLCGIFFVVAFIIALPTPFLWGLRSQIKKYKNRTVTVTLCEKDQMFEKTEYPVGYISTVTAIVMMLLVLMFVQYVLVAMKLLKERRHRMGSGLPMVNAATNTTATPTSASTTSDTSQNGNTVNNTADLTVFDDTERDHSLSINDESDVSENNRQPCDTQNHINAKRPKSRANRVYLNKRVRRKTLIMFILTVSFIITTITYFVLIAIIASPRDILQYLSDSQKAAYFFFLRLYFINHVINPIVYGLLDPQFKCAMRKMKTLISKKCT